MKVHFHVSLMLACLLSGCTIVGHGIGGGGTVFVGADASAVATVFEDNLASHGFRVARSQTNETIHLAFSRGSISGSARFEPETAGYSYCYSASDDGFPWRAGRRLGRVRLLFEESR